MLTHITDDLYYDSRTRMHYHRCNHDYLTDDSGGSFSIKALTRVHLIDPLTCKNCKATWKREILDFILLAFNLGAEEKRAG